MTSVFRVVTGLLPQKKGNIIFNNEKLPSKLEKRSKEQLRKIQIKDYIDINQKMTINLNTNILINEQKT